MVNSPGVRSRRGYEGNLKDAAPTILRLLDIPPAAHMTGTPLDEMYAENAESRVTWRIDQAAERPPAPVLTAAEQAVVEARLRDLGYLD
jgi:hypothetical protein